MWWLFEHIHRSVVRKHYLPIFKLRLHATCLGTDLKHQLIHITTHGWAFGSNIPPTCVFWNPDDAHRSRSAQYWQITFARRYLSQQHTEEQKHIVPTCVQVCVSTLWRATANFYMLSDGYRPPLLEKPPSITVGKLAVACDCKSLHAVTTVTENLSSRNPSRSQLFTFVHLLLK